MRRLVTTLLGDVIEAGKQSAASMTVGGIHRLVNKASIDPVPYMNAVKGLDTALQIFQTNRPNDISLILADYDPLEENPDSSFHLVERSLQHALTDLQTYSRGLTKDDYASFTSDENASFYSHQIKSVLLALTIHYLNDYHQAISLEEIQEYMLLNGDNFEKIGTRFNRDIHVNSDRKNPLTQPLNSLLEIHETLFENRHTDCEALYSLLHYYPILASLPALQREMTNSSKVPLSARIARGILLSIYPAPSSGIEAPELSAEEYLDRFQYNVEQVSISLAVAAIGLVLSVLAINALLSSFVLYIATGISLVKTLGVFFAMTSLSLFTLSASCYLLFTMVSEKATGLIRLDPKPVRVRPKTVPRPQNSAGWFNTAKKPFNYTWQAIMRFCPV